MLKNPLKIYLADLTYDTIVLQTPVFPLNIGFIASYCIKRFGSKVDITLFKYIDELDRAINEAPPDILGMSNYVWNHRIGLEMFRMLTQKNPYALKIWGGPNFPMDPSSQKKFLSRFPEVDVYVPIEGEVGFTNIIESVLEVDSKEEVREQVLSKPIENCIFLGLDRKMQYTFTSYRMKNLDEIPSPYLTGHMDKFFDERLSPMVQTNRGCPFTCTFCVDGADAVRKVNSFSIERVRADIKYIANHVTKKMHDMEISDLNFGMYRRDLEICDYLDEIKKEYDFPHNIHVTTGKNNKERIIESIKRLDGTIHFSMSVQSMDEQVLENIRRDNISVEKMMALAPAIKNSGLDTDCELILALPGESFKSHLQTLGEVLRANMNHILIYSCMMLIGSELDTPEQRKKWDIKTKFRILVRDFVKLSNGKKVIEIEEIITSTNSMTFDEYLDCREVDFAVFASNANPVFKPLLKLLREHDVDLIKLFYGMTKHTNNNLTIQKIFNQFRQLNINELWNSPEEIEAHYQSEAEYQKLLNGEDSFNIMYYSTGQLIAENIVEWLEYTIKLAYDLLKETKKFDNELDEQFLEVANYCKGASYNIMGKDRMLTNPEFVFNYDIKEWLNDTNGSLLSNFKLSSPSRIMFCLTDEQYNLVQENLNIYGKNVFFWLSPRKGETFGILMTTFWRQPINVMHKNKSVQLSRET